MEHTYSLRNEKDQRYEVAASAEGSGSAGSRVRATVTAPDGRTFRYEVLFEGDYAATKANFDESMYLHTAMSIITGQIESHVHQDTRLRVSHASGLIESETDAKLDA